MCIYIAHSRKNASNALNVPSTDKKDTSSVYDEHSQFAYLAHANCFETSSMSLVQRQWSCDGRTYRAETVEQRVDGGNYTGFSYCSEVRTYWMTFWLMFQALYQYRPDTL